MAAASVMPMAAAVRGAVFVGRPVYGAGFYHPYWGSYWGPSWVGPYYAYDNLGEVKLDTKVRAAEVFINGAYAGTTHDNRTIRLRRVSTTSKSAKAVSLGSPSAYLWWLEKRCISARCSE